MILIDNKPLNEQYLCSLQHKYPPLGLNVLRHPELQSHYGKNADGGMPFTYIYATEPQRLLHKSPIGMSRMR